MCLPLKNFLQLVFTSRLVCVCVWIWAELEEEANRPEKDSKTLSSDLIEYVQYMIREHSDNYKVRAVSFLSFFLNSGIPKLCKKSQDRFLNLSKKHLENFEAVEGIKSE